MNDINRSSLTEKDHENMDAFLGCVLDEYRTGGLTKEQAVGEIAHLVAAMEAGNFGEAADYLRVGRKPAGTDNSELPPSTRAAPK